MIPAVALPDGTEVPSVGQGTWYMGERAAEAKREADALRLGIDLGMTLIDTAEMYADGGAEQVVGQAIAGQRDRVFVVSKVYPHNASRKGVQEACARSLKRMRIETIDLYLLHWPGSHPIAETIAGFEALQKAGHIRRWGVSNFDEAGMRSVTGAKGGDACATDQVLYHPDERGIEFDLLPWCAARRIPVMAYSPVGQAGRLLRSPALTAVGKRHGASPAQVAIAWAIRSGNIIAIPKAADPAHVRENAAAGALKLIAQDLAEIDAAHPPPARKQRLAML
ncbi:MAG: aldo/keto reductase [Proteobacteria bacterium]|nr:aldo/keto reductase [Pseudomonadota bacterium]